MAIPVSELFNTLSIQSISTWIRGSGVPLSGTGNNGNWYYDIDTGSVYYKELGSWTEQLLGGTGGNILPWDLTGVTSPAAITLATLPPELPYTNAAVITGDVYDLALTTASAGFAVAIGVVHLADIGLTGKQYFEWIPGAVAGTPMQSALTLYIGTSISEPPVVAIGLTPDGLRLTTSTSSDVVLDAAHGAGEYVRVYIDVDNGNAFVQTANIGVVQVGSGLSLTGLKILGVSQLISNAVGSYTATAELGDDLGSGFVTESGYSPIVTKTVGLPATASVGDELTVTVAGVFDGVQYGIGDGATVVSIEPPSVTPKGATSTQVAAVEASVAVTTARANARTAAFSTLVVDEPLIFSLNVTSFDRGYFLDFSSLTPPLSTQIRLTKNTVGLDLGETATYDGQVVEFTRIDTNPDPATIYFEDYSTYLLLPLSTVVLMPGQKAAFQYMGSQIGWAPYSVGQQPIQSSDMGPWFSPTLQPEYLSYGTGLLKVRQAWDGVDVVCKVNLDTSLGSGTSLISTNLPSEFCPAMDTFVIGTYDAVGGYKPVHLMISASGTMNFYGPVSIPDGSEIFINAHYVK